MATASLAGDPPPESRSQAVLGGVVEGGSPQAAEVEGAGESYGLKAKAFWSRKNEENRSANSGKKATFFQELYGEDEVEFSEEEWVDLAEDWTASLVGFFFGSRPTLGRVQGFVRTRWGDYSVVTVAQTDLGIFLFTFKNEEERDRIVDLGPWTFDNRPLVLKIWSPDEIYSLDSVESIPVWVRFPKLGPHLRRIDALSRIASLVGRPIRTDGYTNGRTKLMYARMLVEVFASREIKQWVSIKGPRGTSFNQRVEYDWLPPRCHHCQSFGHTEKNCKWPRINIDVEDDVDDRVLVDTNQQQMGGEKEKRGMEKEEMSAEGTSAENLDSVVPETQEVDEIEDVQDEVVSRAREIEVSKETGSKEGNSELRVENDDMGDYNREGVTPESPFTEVKRKQKGKKKNESKVIVEDSFDSSNHTQFSIVPESRQKAEGLVEDNSTNEASHDSEFDEHGMSEAPFVEVKKRKKKEMKRKNNKKSEDSEMNLNLKTLVRRSKGKGKG